MKSSGEGIKKNRISDLRRRLKLTASVDVRMVSVMRLILASSALIIIYIDPSEPDRLVQVTYASLILYVIFSLILYLISLVRPLLAWPSNMAWVDICWYIVLVALSSGTNSVFFFFFFFPILVSSFSQGFKSGLRITIASAVCFTVVGFVTAPAEPHFQLNRFLLRPVYLLVLGYMIAYWGGYETKLKERLRFLREISTFSNPRFGIEHTVNWMMERVLAFYRAEAILLVLSDEDSKANYFRMVQRDKGLGNGNQTVGQEIVACFPRLSAEEAMFWNGPRSESWIYNLSQGELSKSVEVRDRLPHVKSQHYLNIPINHHGRLLGRCHIIGASSKYGPLDVDFLLQAIDQVLPVIDNIRLVDHLASDAADREREKIARDIHDSVIQPYIGLQLGLAGIVQKLERGDGDVIEKAKELANLTAQGVDDLRGYTRGMKGADSGGDSLLLPALRRFASKFTDATGISVTIDGSEGLLINDRLAGEVFQMVNEGLSNIRRHTNAQKAVATVRRNDETLIVRIENDTAKGSLAEQFHPQSLAERAADLGGRLAVEINRDTTAVSIQIPL